MFITFEGIDGSGKTTQINKLSERLTNLGYNVLTLREPGGNVISEKIRETLLSAGNDITPCAELLLFVASRAQLVEKVIRPALLQGKLVICDRYIDSSVAYQGYGRGIPIEDILICNKIATRNLVPKITFFLDLPPIIASVRAINRSAENLDRIEQEGEIFFDKARQGYIQISKNEPERFIMLNGSENPDLIHKNIWNYISKII
ncbi:MAG: dTMP kinase [Bacteroidetes bacterium]|nr:dTMP kinase [Bacteroidota bacterium]